MRLSKRFHFRLENENFILYSFRETKKFTKKVAKLLPDDSINKFQFLLIQNPESGDVVPGSGGISKYRWQAKGKGKRGGARIIYYFAVGDETIFLLDIYTKNEKVNITLPELNELRKIVEDWSNKWIKKILTI